MLFVLLLLSVVASGYEIVACFQHQPAKEDRQIRLMPGVVGIGAGVKQQTDRQTAVRHRLFVPVILPPTGNGGGIRCGKRVGTDKAHSAKVGNRQHIRNGRRRAGNVNQLKIPRRYTVRTATKDRLPVPGAQECKASAPKSIP